MGLNRFLQFFIPKESKFLHLLRSQVEDILKASELLITFMNTPTHEERRKLYAEIKAIEKHCDGITNTILDELNNTFITPFDREDINELAMQLDDVTDLITGSAKRTILYQPKEVPESMAMMAEYILESAKCIMTAVDELDKVKRDPSVVKEQCRRLHELENLADDVYENFIISMFKKADDAIELFKMVEIIQILESATDKEYRVSDTLKTIVIKYA